MDDPITKSIQRLVEQSETPEDLVLRVTQSFGEGRLLQARQLAAELRGSDWLHKQSSLQRPQVKSSLECVKNASFQDILKNVLRSPSSGLLVVIALVLLVLLMFPPFLVPLSDGFVNNAGFSFIFNPPQTGNLKAIVNVPLLAVLEIGVLFVGVCLSLAVRLTEKHMVAQRRP